MIEIRQAVIKDIPRIMQFIREYWGKDHIMGNNKTMFEFQHVCDDQVFYIIAEDTVDKKIYGTMGYIPMSEQEWPCASTVMIRSLENPEQRMIGEEMSRFFEQNMRVYNLISVGVNERYAKIIQRISSENIGMLKHFYRLAEKQIFKIAHIENYNRLYVEKSEAKLVPLTTAKQFLSQVILEEIYKDYPRRSPRYIIHRYFEHPYYEYKVYGIQREQEIKSMVVTREENMKDAKVLRIVDFFGRDNDFAYTGKEWDRIMEQKGYEYVDFYCYGLEDKVLNDAGFIERNENDCNIIPNYFSPFVLENINLYFYTWYKEKIHVYKGFGDQDRPNFVI